MPPPHLDPESAVCSVRMRIAEQQNPRIKEIFPVLFLPPPRPLRTEFCLPGSKLGRDDRRVPVREGDK